MVEVAPLGDHCSLIQSRLVEARPLNHTGLGRIRIGRIDCLWLLGQCRYAHRGDGKHRQAPGPARPDLLRHTKCSFETNISPRSIDAPVDISFAATK